ncbi:MAG: ABC-F family ATP-binding cassette domain-containing protein, partial [Acidimicrobiales bacterium]
VGHGWEAAAVMSRLGVGDLASRSPLTLSGGQAKRVALARLLVDDSDLLILDEPTNHLDIEAIVWLEDRLARFTGAVVLVTHDRHVLDRVTNRVLELDRGQGFIHEGGYDRYLQDRAAREATAAASERARSNLARSELAWLRRGAPARTSKSKARLRAATTVVEGRPPEAARPGELALQFGTPRLGDKVIEVAGVGHGFESSTGSGPAPILFENLGISIDRRERLGIVGPNGSGKSTLLDVLAGRLTPKFGSVVIGPTVTLGYYNQTDSGLDPALTPRAALGQDVWLLERFWFDADSARAPIGALSGGERRRLQLLVVLANRPNVILADEPTNDLDLDTLRALEDFLEDWPGALVVASHDRAFLERSVDRVLRLDGHGGIGLVPDLDSPLRPAPTPRSAKPRMSSAPKGPSKTTTVRGRGVGPTLVSNAVEPRRSSSTLGRAMREAEKEMRRLEARRGELAQALARPGYDRHELGRIGTELADVQAELSAAEDRWISLAEESEAD